ncbi:chromate reductase [Mycoplasmoides fastidiosum]|uniref:Chromate reductase n=1 Tax=Mycoplasmoides fastidiosum TaxID=92758 RepID=A0ABU0LYJ7_9BACT|nr:NADPH-dependent FMN reductase [Mycoplasmoides fastidiosum]MDQ0513787.1 chromate reductase [Mycoplasmoides fastidiosum]UUD37795.1 NAD(P)H-dependent oxidoreductase [Mycoplasmoides fastidiosum]
MDKTLVIAAVNSANSINLDLSKKISYAGSYDLLDLNDYKQNLPILSNSLLAEKKFPEQIKEILVKLTGYQNVIIVTPEHNGYYSAFFKNIMDWLSRLDNAFFLDKNVVLVVASPGKLGGLSLRKFASETLKYTGAKSIKDFEFGSYSVDQDVAEKVQEVVEYINNL